MNYVETKIIINPFTSDSGDLLSMLLAEIGYDSFVENENGISAFVSEKLYDARKVEAILDNFKDAFESLVFSSKIIKGENWNKKWEENFTPMFIDDFCLIKAPFHNIKEHCKYEIIIEPKMSFGTGHHATTASMIRLMNTLNFDNMQVLDMGCGTGILSIFANKKNAKNILAIDIDQWAYDNSVENAKLNDIQNITIKQGDADLLYNKKFDIILANINRNVLTEQMSTYANCLNKHGYLLVSGFYTEDMPIIKQSAENEKLKYEKYITENNWVAVLFTK